MNTKTVKTFKDLLVWQKSVSLVEVVYNFTSSFPKEEIYGLTSQMRRASISIASNIAEGSSRKTTKEFIRFLSIANGSLMELETQLIIAEKLQMLSKNNCGLAIEKIDEISRMINSLINSLLRRVEE